MFIADLSVGGEIPIANSGSRYLSAVRTVSNPDYPTSQEMGVFQNVDLTPYASLINLGSHQMNLSFAYNDNDPNDTAVVAYSFLDSIGSTIGNSYTFTAASGVDR